MFIVQAKKAFSNCISLMQVKKEDIGPLLEDAVKHGKAKLGGKGEKENAEEVDDPNPAPVSKPVNAVKKPPQVQVLNVCKYLIVWMPRFSQGLR